MANLNMLGYVRAIVTTHKLEISGTSIRTALETLFTAYERKKLWVLWLTPGLLSAFLLNILLRFLVFRPLRLIIEPAQYHFPTKLDGMYYLRVAGMILLFAMVTAILAPLDVIITRLAIQRSHGPEPEPASPVPEVGDVDLEKADASGELELEPEASATIQYVKATCYKNHLCPLPFRLRQDKDRYLSLYDCTKRIVREEGWQVLYRGWWLVFLGILNFY
jgi:Mitochondrial carrier protein